MIKQLIAALEPFGGKAFKHMYTVFRSDYDESPEPPGGMFNQVYTSLDKAKESCRADLIDHRINLELDGPGAEWAVCNSRNGCWVLDDEESGIVFHVLECNIDDEAWLK